MYKDAPEMAKIYMTVRLGLTISIYNRLTQLNRTTGDIDIITFKVHGIILHVSNNIISIIKPSQEIQKTFRSKRFRTLSPIC